MTNLGHEVLMTNLASETHRLEQFNDVLFQENGFNNTNSPLFDLHDLHAINRKKSIVIEKLGVWPLSLVLCLLY